MSMVLGSHDQYLEVCAHGKKFTDYYKDRYPFEEMNGQKSFILQNCFIKTPIKI